MEFGKHNKDEELHWPQPALRWALKGPPRSRDDTAPFQNLRGVLSVTRLAPGNEICYRPFGCFSDEKPWAGTIQRPVKLFPWAPEDIDTQFHLYTNENPNNYQVRAGTA